MFGQSDRGTETIAIIAEYEYWKEDVSASQCHGYWWPGDAMSQGINNHDIIKVFEIMNAMYKQVLSLPELGRSFQHIIRQSFHMGGFLYEDKTFVIVLAAGQDF